MTAPPDAGIAWLFVVGLAILAASWWRRWRARWTRRLRLSGSYGTVYVVQDRDQPHLLKVGVTVRPSRTRQAEIGAAEWRHLLAELERAAHDVRRLARRQDAWSPEDDAEAGQWSLTSTGPARTSLFQTDRTMQHPLRAQLP